MEEKYFTWIGVGILALAVYSTYKGNGDKAIVNEEDDNVKRQSCVNAGKEANIPDEHIERFVTDCLASLNGEEEKEVIVKPKLA